MRKIPTNSSAPPRKAELPLDLSGPHVDLRASAPHRLYQALRHAIVSGIAKPGEPLPPSRTLASQTGYHRNAVTTAYERLIADGLAVASVGSGTFVAARIPTQANSARSRAIAIPPPQQGILSLGCTHIDVRALQRFRSFVGRRMRAFGTDHLHYGDPRGSLRTSHRHRRSFAVGARAALRSRPDHADVGNAARLADRAERHSQA